MEVLMHEKPCFIATIAYEFAQVLQKSFENYQNLVLNLSLFTKQ